MEKCIVSSTAGLISELAKGGSLPTEDVSSGIEGESVHAQESTQDDLIAGESEDTPQDDLLASDEGTVNSNTQAKTKVDPASKEVITVTDESGRKRKVEIDYSNKEATKKAHLLAAGARKWQAERDQAIQKSKAIESEKAELKSNWDALEGAFQKSGVEGVIDLLEGRQGAHKAWLQKQLDRHEFLKKASPEEVESLQARERAELSQKELERIRKENDDFKKQITSEREQADMASLESRVHPVFDKHRFADKLGDANDEHMFDELLWNSAMKRLEPYEEQFGTASKIPSEIIEREFRNVAAAVRKRIGTQAEKKASKVIDQKKQEATENVQAKVMSGYKTGGSAQEARDLLNQGGGGLTKLMSNWGKYGSLFNK